MRLNGIIFSAITFFLSWIKGENLNLIKSLKATFGSMLT